MEDTQPLTDPIITPVQSKNFDARQCARHTSVGQPMIFIPGMLLPCSSEDLLEKKMPDTTFDFNFLAAMMDKPNLVRAVLHIPSLGLWDVGVFFMSASRT